MTHGEFIRVTIDQVLDLFHQIATVEFHKIRNTKQFYKKSEQAK